MLTCLVLGPAIHHVRCQWLVTRQLPDNLLVILLLGQPLVTVEAPGLVAVQVFNINVSQMSCGTETLGKWIM